MKNEQWMLQMLKSNIYNLKKANQTGITNNNNVIQSPSWNILICIQKCSKFNTDDVTYLVKTQWLFPVQRTVLS